MNNFHSAFRETSKCVFAAAAHSRPTTHRRFATLAYQFRCTKLCLCVRMCAHVFHFVTSQFVDLSTPDKWERQRNGSAERRGATEKCNHPKLRCTPIQSDRAEFNFMLFCIAHFHVNNYTFINLNSISESLPFLLFARLFAFAFVACAFASEKSVPPESKPIKYPSFR